MSEESQVLAKEDSANRNEASTTVSEKVLEESWWASHCKNSVDAALEVAGILIQEAKKLLIRRK